MCTLDKGPGNVGWLVNLFIQPLASGYYSRHPEAIQYNKSTKTKMREKGTKAGENSVCM